MVRKKSVMPVIGIVFDRKKETEKDKKALGLVQVRVSLGSKRSYVSTSVRVHAKEWDTKQLRVKSRGDAFFLNNQIASMQKSVEDFVMKSGNVFSWQSFERFRDNLRLGAESKNFIKWMRERIDARNDLSAGTKRHYICTIDLAEDMGFFISFDDITLQEVYKFNEALLKRGIEQSTIYGHHKRIRKCIKDAINLGYFCGENPYTRYSPSKGTAKPRTFLTDEELELLRKSDVIPVLRKVLDMFLFQCFTGLSFSDMNKFNFKKDVQYVDGRYEIRDIRQKTSVEYYIVLLKPAVELLRKYDWELPKMSLEQYNLRIKIVMESVGLKKHVSSHVARHTFACFALKHGVSIENLSKMLGHSNIRTTQIYAKVLNSSVREEYEKLNKLF